MTKPGAAILLWANLISGSSQPHQILLMLSTNVSAFQVIPEFATLWQNQELVLIYLQPNLKDVSFIPKTTPLIIGSMC